jgi:hypothetical protein
MKYLLLFFMLLGVACWGQSPSPLDQTMRWGCTAAKNLDTSVGFHYDTTKFYPVIDTTGFKKVHGCWQPILDTIWKPKIQVYLTPGEWKKLRELLHPSLGIRIILDTFPNYTPLNDNVIGDSLITDTFPLFRTF